MLDEIPLESQSEKFQDGFSFATERMDQYRGADFMGIYRNIPFTILGVVIIILFFRSEKAEQDKPFGSLWLAVVISFACYIPVVLFADTVPIIGMLMIPKTCAYVWVVLIGYKAMKITIRSGR